MVVFDLNKLKGKMREKGVTYQALADVLGIDISTVSQTFNHKRYFKLPEVAKTANLLGIIPTEIGEYFFTYEVK